MYLKQRIRELDIVELTEPTGPWPAGSRGTVMIDFGEDKMLEMVGEREDPLDLFPTVPASKLKLLTMYGLVAPRPPRQVDPDGNR